MKFIKNRGVEGEYMPYFFNSETQRLVENASFFGPFGAISRTMKIYSRLGVNNRYEQGNGDLGRFLPVIWLYVRAHEYFSSSSTRRRVKTWLYRLRLKSFLRDYLVNIRHRLDNLDLDQTYIIARAAMTIGDQDLANQLIRHGLHRTSSCLGHIIRGRLIALYLLNGRPNLILTDLKSPEEDSDRIIDFSGYDPVTKALIYRSYALLTHKTSPTKACAFLKVAIKLIGSSPIDRIICQDILDQIERGDLTISDREKLDLWNRMFLASGKTRPYPSG